MSSSLPGAKLSVVIVNWNTHRLLLQALASIYQAPPPFSFEVIVVDNASSDESARAVRERYPQALLIANSENEGYAKGNNQGLLVSRGEYVLLLNPDVRVPEGGLERAVAIMEQLKDVGALGVRQAFPNGQVQKSVRGFPTPSAVFWELIGLSRLYPSSSRFGAYRMTWFDYEHEADVDQPMATFLMIRRQVLDQVGLMDESFPIFFNDVDWCFRCKQAGWRILFTPEIEIIHHGGAGTIQAGGAMAWESRRGLLRFYALHYRALPHRLMRLLVAGISWPYAWLQARRIRNRRDG